MKLPEKWWIKWLILGCVVLFMCVVESYAERYGIPQTGNSGGPRTTIERNNGSRLPVYLFWDTDLNIVCYVTDSSIDCLKRSDVYMKKFNTKAKELKKVLNYKPRIIYLNRDGK